MFGGYQNKLLVGGAKLLTTLNNIDALKCEYCTVNMYNVMPIPFFVEMGKKR